MQWNLVNQEIVMEQVERIARLEANQDNVMDRLEKIEKEVKDGFKSVEQQLWSFIKSADEKYASKLTQIMVYAFAWMVLVAVIWALIALVVIRWGR